MLWPKLSSRQEAIDRVEKFIADNENKLDASIFVYLNDRNTISLVLIKKEIKRPDGTTGEGFQLETRSRDWKRGRNEALLKFCPLLMKICWHAGHWPGMPTCAHAYTKNLPGCFDDLKICPLLAPKAKTRKSKNSKIDRIISSFDFGRED